MFTGKMIRYLVEDPSGQVDPEATLGATRRELDSYPPTLPQPRTIAG
jgi:hypothetical protein